MSISSSSRAKTILFWISIAFVGLMLWKLVSASGQSAREEEPSYSEFMAKVDAGQVREVTMYLSSNSYELQGEYVIPGNRKFRITIFKEAALDLTRALRDKAVRISVRDLRTGDWTLTLIAVVPLVLLVGFWVFLVRQMQSRGVQPLKTRQGDVRFGLGYDLHRLDAGRPFVVGEVEIPFDKGPVGHSDGDVLAHAICDAVLGAAGAGDIGTLFPDTDPQWKGVSSLIFLEQVAKVLQDQKQSIGYIDAVVIAEKPKLGPHFAAMKATLAKSLKIKPEQISLKAKTNEGVDAVGRGEAIAAHAIATLVNS